MTHALHRLTSVLTDWIPDLSGVPVRRQVTVGIAVSVLLHLLIILILALLLGGQPEHVDFAKPKVPPRGIELVVQPPEPEPLVPFTLAPNPDQPFIDSRGLDIAQQAADNAIFQSDENMRAASELPATGDAPLPSQEGKDRPFNAFKTQRSLLGNSTPQPFPPAEEQPPLPVPDPVVAPPAPPMVAQQTPPAPPAPAEVEKAEKADPEPPAPKPVIEPQKTADLAKAEDIAMTPKSAAAVTEIKAPPATPMPAKPILKPRPMEEPQQQAKLTTPAPLQQQAKPTTPVPKPQTARESGYQPELEQNKIEGNISNRGKKAVDAVATPLAKYRKQVNDAIGSRWYYYVKDPRRMSLIAPGSARVSFFIDSEGQVVGIKLDANTSNESFAELCTSAVRDAKEQIKELKFPADSALLLKDGRLECSLTFTFYNL